MPKPNKFICEVVIVWASGTVDITEIKISAVPITIMLFAIGAYIGNVNEFREFRICEAKVYKP